MVLELYLRVMWKEELVRNYPEWEHYYKSFDLWLKAKEELEIFDKKSVRYFGGAIHAALEAPRPPHSVLQNPEEGYEYSNCGGAEMRKIRIAGDQNFGRIEYL